MEFSLHNEGKTKLVNSLSLTMDYDSGYMSHNPESNLDSSLESNSNESMLKSEVKKPIYLSEDALLEKPVVKNASLNLSLEIENENYEETRSLFFSPDINDSETAISDSVASQETSYSVFNDSEVETSISPIIPPAKPLVVDSASIKSSSNFIYNDEKICSDVMGSITVENNFTGKLDKQYVKSKLPSALSNITNTFETSSSDKKLTLIFSRNNKENYSVKRKFPSLSPRLERSIEHSESVNVSTCLEESSVSEQSSPEKHSISITELDKSTSFSESRDFEKDDEIGENTSECLVTLIGEMPDNIHNSYILLEKITLDSAFESTISVSQKTDFGNDLIHQEEQISVGTTSDIVNNPLENIVSEEIKYNDNLKTEEFEKASDITDFVQSKTFIATDDHKNTEKKENMIYTNQFDDNSQSLSNMSEIVVNKNFVLPEIINISATPTKKFQNSVNPNLSPDLFDEEETQEVPLEEPIQSNKIASEKYINKKDYSLVKRAYNSIKGVLPPNSMTIVKMSVSEMLNKIETNKNYFWDKELPTTSTSKTCNNSVGYKSLLITEPVEAIQKKEWPAVLEGRYLGVHYNRSKLSERFEELCTQYAQRYVGAETQSSCTSFDVTYSSPLKRKQIKQRWSVKSPGRRLSHLARRRITFSNVGLQASSSFAGSRARQILVDAKKMDLLKQKSPKKTPRKTPKKTPSKSPRSKTRTPSSSAKKKLAMRFRKLTGEIETTGANNAILSSKRALFRSPSHDKSSLFAPSTSGVSAFENESKKPTKRALFMSPSKNSPLKNSPFKKSPFKRLELGIDKKRKRSESEDPRPTKLCRTVSEILKPSESEFKTMDKKNLFNVSLSQGQIGELSTAHKKKLQWAVYEALRAQEITPSHAQFKLFASILARVTRRLLPYANNGISGKEMGTSERMLRITKFHVFSVIKGKTVDEIVNDYLRSRVKQAKPQGYVGIEEFNSAKKKENVLQDRSNLIQSLEKKKLDSLGKPKTSSSIDRIRKVINFGDDDNR